MEDLISIIVPVYNVEKYISKCINSIIEQTYTNIEIILVDDGSPDNCPQICDEFAKKDKRIRVLHKANGGLSAARNYGIDNANGKYICFIDSDDFISNDYIEILFKLIKKYNVEISVINYAMIEDGKVVDKKEEYAISEKKINQEQAIIELLKKDGIKDFAWNKMYDISLFEDIRYPYNRKMEDMGTTYKLFLKAKGIAISNQKKYFYVQRKDSILHDLNENFFNDKFFLANERFYCLKNKYPDLLENYLFMLQTCIECYPYLSRNNEDKCKQTMMILEQNKKIYWKRINYKIHIKYFVYKINKCLYKKIFRRA